MTAHVIFPAGIMYVPKNYRFVMQIVQKLPENEQERGRGQYSARQHGDCMTSSLSARAISTVTFAKFATKEPGACF